MSETKEIAILIPCFNEEKTIQKVISDFKENIPEAKIYVYDNNSTDSTRFIAEENGAVVGSEHRQGKGYVVQTMFKEVDADVYIMVDGDDTYPASSVHKLCDPILNGEADMVVGNRLASYFSVNTDKLHSIGNHLVPFLINSLFRADIGDVMSGYRAFSKTLAKSMELHSGGFQIETEITLYCLKHKQCIYEVDIPYSNRPEGSHTKIHAISDGIKIVTFIFKSYFKQ